MRVQEVDTTTEGRYITVDRSTYGKIGAAIYLHPVALSFLNIIVDQIWLKATIFGLLMLNCVHVQAVGLIIFRGNQLCRFSINSTDMG